MKGGRGPNRAGSALTWVSGECEGPGGSGRIFLFFKVYFSTCWGMEGVLVLQVLN